LEIKFFQASMNSPAPRRTLFTTLIGVAAILLGGLGSVFSLFALLLAIGKPYANSASDPLGIFLIFILPPGTLLAGIGLLLRHRWARWWMILLMAGLVALGGNGLLAPDHANPAYAPMPGPAADAAKRFVFIQSVSCIAVGSLVLLGSFSRPVRREFQAPEKSAPAFIPSAPPPLAPPASPQEESQGWRVGHRGRDVMFYEELHGGTWQRLDIDGEMLTGRAHHVIYFASAETWQRYPEWARQRRDEIIARIKSRFREPDYEYQETGSAFSPPAPASSVVRPPGPRRDGTILPVLVALLLIAAGAFWLAARAWETGETRLPLKNNPASRSVSRDENPALFWTSISLISALGTGCTGFAAWLVIGHLRRR
jgi:hypothetical protein